MRFTDKTASKSLMITLACAAALSATALSGCGIKGDLKTPPPVFGSERLPAPLEPAPIGKTTPPSSTTQNSGADN